MNERILTKQFQEAWLTMNVDALSALMADSMRFSSIATFSSFDCKRDFIKHVSRIFQNLKANQALTIPGKRNYKAGFDLTYQYETLVPITHYMISKEGLGLVSCLEYRVISLETNIKLSFKEKLISEIKIIQKRNIKCRKTAQQACNFASSTRKKPLEDEN